MRSFVFLLILANLLFFAWTQGYLGSVSSADAYRVHQQLLADRVKVVARDEPPPETTPTEAQSKPVENKAPETCLAVSDLAAAIADQIEARVAEKLPAFKIVRSTTAATANYWVYIPPLANKKDADAKASELKKLGITDFFVVQESGANNRAISLGLFSSKDAASAYLETLRGKGVKSAKMTERPGKAATAALEIHGPEAQSEALRQQLVEIQAELKPGACKPQTTVAP